MWNLDSNFGYQQQQSNYYLQKEIEDKFDKSEKKTHQFVRGIILKTHP